MLPGRLQTINYYPHSHTIQNIFHLFCNKFIYVIMSKPVETDIIEDYVENLIKVKILLLSVTKGKINILFPF